MPTTAWPARHLRPLLLSSAQIDACINLPSTMLPKTLTGSMILCKLDHNPWKKPVVLLMGWTMANNPGSLFSAYEIIPLFQASPLQASCPKLSSGKTSPPTLSEAQQNYESAALSKNGGLHYLWQLGFQEDGRAVLRKIRAYLKPPPMGLSPCL